MTTTFTTIQTRVTKDDDKSVQRTEQLDYRTRDLNGLGRNGYQLTHTHVIDGTDYVTFVDTLSRTN